MILSYVIPGFCVITAYLFVMGQNYGATKSRLLQSIVVSFFCKSTIGTLVSKIDFLNETKHSTRFVVALSIVSMIVATLIGIICKSKKVNNILLNSLIGRSFNQNFWVDVVQAGFWYRIHIKDSDVVYEGQITKVEEQCRTPFVELSGYRVFNLEQTKELKNFNHEHKNCSLPKNEERTIIINTELVDYIVCIDPQADK